MKSEENLIERVVKAIPAVGKAGQAWLRLGIGDDAAILRSNRGFEWVISCDTFLEGVHFVSGTHPAKSVGYKALARAASDLVAMGATPRLFLMSLTIPKERTGEWLDELLSGMALASTELRMGIAGGDTTRGACVSLNMTVLGEVRRGRALRRSGARPGDLIYVSGRLGAAQLGLVIAMKGLLRDQRFAALVQQHLYPSIPVPVGYWLQRRGVATAAIDISDGLSTDLTRLARASEAGARIYAEKIPTVKVPEAARQSLGPSRIDPLQMALHGGDDYQLLFTVPERRVKSLRSAPGFEGLSCIGEMTDDRQIVMVDHSGRTRALEASGWDPFRG